MGAACWLATVAVAAKEATPAPPPPREPGAPMVIGAPHYGDTLFHFYQDQDFAAITGLMVSQHFNRVAPHDDEAEVLRGGMLLAYGLHDEAARVFTQLIEGHAAPSVRDRAWYFLARMRYQRGLFDAAGESLARVAAPLQGPDGALEDDRQLLAAQLLMARGDDAAAATALEGLQASQNAGLVARFNLGVALLRSGQGARGLALLDQLGQIRAANEEQRTLRDRANLALGLAALQRGEGREASAALQRVRLNGAQSNPALLGFGWAAAQQGEPRLALVPWTELAGRDASDAAVLEARIAVPYALAELGAYGQSLQGYEEAITGFEQERRALDESMRAIRAGHLVDGLLAQNADSGPAGLARRTGLRTVPPMPHAAHLLPLLAGNAFQEAFKNLRDLRFAQGNVQHWLDALGSYTDMLDNRRQAFAERLPAVRASAGAIDIDALHRRRAALAAELAQAQASADAAAFADPRERGLLQRIADARAALAHVAGTPDAHHAPDAPDAAEVDERLRRVEGALQWQMAQALPARRWDATKALRGTDTALAEARARDAALLQAQQAEPARHARFAARIAALALRLNALTPRVAALDAEQRQHLQDIAVAELQAQQQRLDVYAAQARLAIAQIHDRAAVSAATARATDDPAAAFRTGAPR